MTDDTTLEPIRCAISETDPETYEVRRLRDGKLLAQFDISEDHGVVLVQLLMSAIHALAKHTIGPDTTIN